MPGRRFESHVTAPTTVRPTWGRVGGLLVPAMSDETIAVSPGGTNHAEVARPAWDTFRIGFAALVLLAFAIRVAFRPGNARVRASTRWSTRYDLDALYIANTHHYPPVYGPHGPAPNAYRPPAYAYLLGRDLQGERRVEPRRPLGSRAVGRGSARRRRHGSAGVHRLPDVGTAAGNRRALSGRPVSADDLPGCVTVFRGAVRARS